jgi:hypothetical protein
MLLDLQWRHLLINPSSVKNVLTISDLKKNPEVFPCSTVKMTSSRFSYIISLFILMLMKNF